MVSMSGYQPHANTSHERILETVLGVKIDEFEGWSQTMASIALDLASEFFLLHYNPFVPAEVVYNSVFSRLEQYREYLSESDYSFLADSLTRSWEEYQDLQKFRQQVKERLQEILPEESVLDSPHSRIQNSTDATGLVMELPLLVVYPQNTEHVRQIVLQARELGFSIVPRGGGSGLTGGALPVLRKTVIMSISRLKEILEVDEKQMLLRAQAGVITLDAIKEASRKGMLFTVDPASKAASSLGGNIAENAGGPYAFEYGTTLDNIYSYKMVRPDGKLVEVKRKDHPWHKIYPHEEVVFEIYDEDGSFLESITLKGEDIRGRGLGKDVTNKFLGGLPGVQKEGVDGIITEASFVLHPELKYTQTLCLEFYGSSMHNAALVIKDLVRLRDRLREKTSDVTMSALEEFGSKYVKAIQYKKKTSKYEGEPISVLLIQLASNNKRVLRDTAWTITDIADHYDNVDVIVAKNKEEAESFWEDRHRLSAISKKTSGFKINEDVVIPLEQIPAFSDFLESMNLKYLAIAYKNTLQKIKKLPAIKREDDFIKMEEEVCQKILEGYILEHVPAEQDFALQIHYFFQDLFGRYPQQKNTLQKLEQDLFDTRLEIANHMHAGDGNCHVNIPVHANNAEMNRQAEQVVDRIFEKALELGGQVSGEHGIGVTKVGYLSPEKIEALNEYREKVDPDRVMNPEKLTSKELTVSPYTFSWSALVHDFSSSEMPHKEQLAQQLQHIQVCTRCGKCKQVCPMYYPQKGMLYHPRNKNLSLAALLDALLYTRSVDEDFGQSQHLLAQLNDLMSYCTACGKCMTTCPVKIDSADVTINMRSYLEEEGPAGWGLKSKMLSFLGEEPQRIETVAKIATLGQNFQNRAIRFLPSFWRRRAENPVFQAPGPKLELGQINEILDVRNGNLFSPEHPPEEGSTAVIYLPGCGSALFYPSIALASIDSLLNSGFSVVLPDHHLCCGYPLLSAGCTETYERNQARNIEYFQQLLDKCIDQGLNVKALVTSCGTCRASIENYELQENLFPQVELQDVFQFLYPYLDLTDFQKDVEKESLIFHASCHTAMAGVSPAEANYIYLDQLEALFNKKVHFSPYCCAESGLGALTNPKVYNNLRKRKINSLQDLINQIEDNPKVLVSCPSCKIGIYRSLIAANKKNKVLHTMEYIAQVMNGQDFRKIMQDKILAQKYTSIEAAS